MTIEYTPTADTAAASHWETLDQPCAECCGPWVGFVRRKWRQAELDTDPPITLGGVEPPINSVMGLYLDGCYAVCVPPEYPGSCEPLTTEGDRDDCLQTFADVVTAREADLDDAETFEATAAAAVATAQDDYDSALVDVASTLGTMETERVDYSEKQLDLMGLKIREQMYVQLGDTANAEATAVEIADLEADLLVHPYHDALTAYDLALGTASATLAELYSRIRSYDEAVRLTAIAQARLDYAQANETLAAGSSAPDVTMRRLELADVGFFLSNGAEIAMLSVGTQREGWYILGLDITTIYGGFTDGYPLPSDDVNLLFEWREQFRPDDTELPYTYSDFSESVVLVADTSIYALTEEHHIDPPTTEGTTYIVSPPRSALVEFVREVQGGSLGKSGFMAYKTTEQDVSRIFGLETASGGNDSETFTGSQQIVDGSVEDTFSENVPENAKSLVWPGSVQTEATPVTEDEEERTFSDGLVMTLTEEVETTDITSPVDAYVGEAWGTDPPEDIFSPLFDRAHSVLMGNDTTYSAAKERYKLYVTIPTALPYDIEIECKWTERVLDFETGDWVIDEVTRNIIMPAGDIEFLEDDWTEVTASAGTIVYLDSATSTPHADIFTEGPVVSIET